MCTTYARLWMLASQKSLSLGANTIRAVASAQLVENKAYSHKTRELEVRGQYGSHRNPWTKDESIGTCLHAEPHTRAVLLRELLPVQLGRDASCVSRQVIA